VSGAAMSVRAARIPVRDGTELAATLYLPAAAAAPVPALLEYLPYRKDDAMLARDYELYAHVTRHGYAGARVDIRGTGGSGGELPDGEYSEQEQRDAEDVIAWLAGQPWCSGAVGMWGISWGGFNAIQVALRRPPALKAIIAVDASDDLFHDDVHYIDGLLHLDEYALMIDHLNALPPAPGYPLDEDILAARFDSEPWLLTWLGQQQDGPYWRRASLRPDYGRLTLPAFLIGGWYDGYRDSIPRMLASCPAPIRALLGPWNHTFPHNAVPGPAIEWRAEAVRWWDHWLKGIDTGLLAEPPVTVFVQQWHAPDPDLAELPGCWRTESALPPDRTQYQSFYCRSDGKLAGGAPADATVRLRYVPSAGVEAGHWWGELTVDQRGADAFGLTFDTEPLDADIEILGFPRVEIHGSSDADPLHWFARLCDVAPDGTVTLVTGAGRAGRPDELRDAAPASPSGMVLDLHVTSWVFARGHKLRLVLSNAMWPMIWPTPHQDTAVVRLGSAGTRLTLPVIPPEPRPLAANTVLANTVLANTEPDYPVPGPAQRPSGISGWGDMLPTRWTVERDASGTATAWWRGTSGSEFGWGRVIDEEYLRYQVRDADPAHAKARGEARTEIHLADRLLAFLSILELDSDETSLRYRCRRELRKDGVLVRERSWERQFPRIGQ
jgi:predicted acyl esterase